tara:strand:- start:82 stop:1053 length:972 start_codon:yes stop_codon:yes gene_type:complete
MFNKKNILITGGTGSFGKNFINYILKNYRPNKLIIYSRDELKQYELSLKIKDKCVRFFLGDIRDQDRFFDASKKIDIIIHAAALKQVPAAEYNPFEFIKTNILGAQNIIACAIKNEVEKTIALSTDKAVAPINLYGATKLCSDKLFIAANNMVGNNNVTFSVVRYGNVVNSRGSLFPKIKNSPEKQIKLTHKNMTRFFIKLDDSVKFVEKSIKLMKGGEIFIPKIPAYKIYDMIKILKPNAKIKIIGIRPGEKIHESLFSKDDSNNVVEFNDYYIIKPSINLTKKINYKRNKLGQVGKQIKNSEYISSNHVKITKKEIKKLDL